jgi:hypothetical protein
MADAVQHFPQPVLVPLPVNSTAEFLVAEVPKGTDFFTAIQARHGFVAN